MQRLALGTVQFGLPYGIANCHGQVGLREAAEILDRARAAGMDMLDTAVAYGGSEQRLGEIGVHDWRIISKLPALPSGTFDAGRWVSQQVSASLQRLKVDRLYGLLLHRPGDLLENHGEEIHAALQNLKACGIVGKIGISIYSPDELGALFTRFDINLVQAPFNILDRRLVTSGWLDRLHAGGVEVHVRSIFLQGLLLMTSADRHASFNRWQNLLRRWHVWLEDTGLSPLQACLGYVLAQPYVERIVIGIDTLHQLGEILSIAPDVRIQVPDDLCSNDIDLINPSRWKLTS